MRELVIAVLALLGLILLPAQVKGQDKDSIDKAWPTLGSEEKIIGRNRPRFIIDIRKLEIAQNVSNPLSIPRCSPPSKGCRDWIEVVDFFSDIRGLMKMEKNILRPDVMMHHYRNAALELYAELPMHFDMLKAGGMGPGDHYLNTGTYVFYLIKYNVFYLWGDCGMSHSDEVAGPFAGDPRLVLKKLAEESAAK